MNKMTETKLYRKVYCKDRLPDEEGEYLTDIGIIFYVPKHKRMTYAEYWFERIQLSTDEEIEGMAEEYSFVVPFDGSDKFYDGIKNKSFIDGFKKCLELLKDNIK